MAGDWGGLLLGLACLGRQTYLVLIAGLVMAAWTRQSRSAAVAGAISAVIPLIVMAPVVFDLAGAGAAVAAGAGMGEGIAPVQALLGLSYGGLNMALLAPRFLKVRMRVAVALVGVGVVLALCSGLGIISRRLGWRGGVLPGAMIPVYGRLAAVGFTTLGVFFAWGCVRVCVGHERRGVRCLRRCPRCCYAWRR